MKKIILFLSIFSAVTVGCYNHVEEELFACSTTGVTYSGTVVAILNSNQCLSCHTGVAPQGGFALETYNEVKAKASDGSLYGSISHSPGFHPMPHGGSKIADCDIKRIKAWIDSGAPNN